MKAVSTKEAPSPDAVLWQGATWNADGSLLHCGPFWARKRMSLKTLRKRERRWQAWRVEAYGERVPGFSTRRIYAMPPGSLKG